MLVIIISLDQTTITLLNINTHSNALKHSQVNKIKDPQHWEKKVLREKQFFGPHNVRGS